MSVLFLSMLHLIFNCNVHIRKFSTHIYILSRCVKKVVISSLFPAERYLYDILTKESVVKKKIPLLLLCNKVDKVTAHSKDFIRRQLEKEM